MGSSEVSYVGAFFFRSSFSNLKKVMIGHVASPFYKERAARRAYTVPSNVLMDEYPLETFDNMTLTEIKARNFFKGMNSWEQGALGLILHTARDYQRMCTTSTRDSLENQEHAALTDEIRRLLEKNERESRELAKRTADDLREQLHKLTQFNEGRLRCGPDRNQDFVARVTGGTIDPQRMFDERLGATKNAAAAAPAAEPKPTRPVRQTKPDKPSNAAPPNLYAPNSYAAGLAEAPAKPTSTKNTPVPSSEQLITEDETGSMLPQLAVHFNVSPEEGPTTTTHPLPQIITLTHKTPIQEADGWDWLGRNSAVCWGHSPLLSGMFGMPPPTPVNQFEVEPRPPSAFLLFFDQPRPGNEKHVGVLHVLPVLCGVTAPRLQDARLGGHVVARLKVHPIPLADVVVGHEADLGLGTGGRIGGDVAQGVGTVGLVEPRVGLQAVADQVLEEDTEDFLLLELSLLVFADCVLYAGVAQQQRNDIMSGLDHIHTEYARPILNPIEGNWEGWKRQ